MPANLENDINPNIAKRMGDNQHIIPEQKHNLYEGVH